MCLFHLENGKIQIIFGFYKELIRGYVISILNMLKFTGNRFLQFSKNKIFKKLGIVDHHYLWMESIDINQLIFCM